jgi:hypothetical protein
MSVTLLFVILGALITFVGTCAGRATRTRSAQARSEQNPGKPFLGKGLPASLSARDAACALQLAGVLLCVVSGFCFTLFLRAVANCFRDQGCARLAELYLLSSAALVAVTVALVLDLGGLARTPELLPWLGAAWLVCFGGHLLLVLWARACLTGWLENLLPPPE